MTTYTTDKPGIQTDTLPRAPAVEPEAGLVDAQGLTKQFNSEYAVRDLMFSIPPNTIFGLIGPSGCGKTTCIRLLTGIYEPTTGSARVLGESPQHFSAATRERLGYMPQQFVLYPNLSVWENLGFTASLYGMGFGRGRRLKKMLEFVELYEHRNKLARSISGGMQRRLALAATLAHDPQLIFLDEPTAGIDPMLRRKFWDYFQDLKANGRTLLVTTQYVGEAAYCDLVGVMANGRLLMVETPDGLRQRAFGGELVDLLAQQPLDYRTVAQIRSLSCIVGPLQPLGETGLRLVVNDAGTAVPMLIDWAQEAGLSLHSVEKYEPPLDDVFVEVVKREHASGE